MAKDLLEQAKDLHRQGRLPQARKAYRRLLNQPGASRAVAGLIGALELEAGRLEEALNWTDKALALDPADANALGNRCVVLHRQGRLEDALACYETLVERIPASAQAWFNRGHVLKLLGRSAEALDSYRRAVRLAPGFAAAHNNIGNMLIAADRPGEAIEAFEAALAAAPQLHEARKNLGLALQRVGRLQAALPLLQEAVKNFPQDPWALGAALEVKQKLADWDGLSDLVERLRRYLKLAPAEVRPFMLLSLDFEPDEQRECAAAWAERARAAASAAAEAHPAPRSIKPITERRLHIGYLSGDFRVHPVAILLGEVFALHDRQAFKTSAWSFGPDDGSEVRRSLVEVFEEFHDIAAVDDDTAAAMIREAGVDILVDLAGYTWKNCTDLLARRAAPLQVGYFGYGGTSGAPWMDWLIADPVIVPRDRERHYSERIARLPGSLMINDRRRPAPGAMPRAACGLPEDAFVFCCFNQPYKVTPQRFALWMEILRRSPHAVLWLAADEETAQRNLRAAASVHGVDPARLHFAARLPAEADHLARLQAADLFLDTFPYTAHATAVDALWVGLPVLTQAGDTFASRVCASALHAVGLPQLVTDDAPAYVESAVDLARSPETLGRMRAHLRNARAQAPLFDTAAYTRELEAIYRAVWAAAAEPSGTGGTAHRAFEHGHD